MMVGTLQPEDIFTKRRAYLVESLDLENTSLLEILVENKLLSNSQLKSIMVETRFYILPTIEGVRIKTRLSHIFIKKK